MLQQLYTSLIFCENHKSLFSVFFTLSMEWAPWQTSQTLPVVPRISHVKKCDWLVTWSRLEKLLITNRKSHMSFRLIPKSVTLNDLERHISPKLWVISSNLVPFWAHYIKVVEDTPYFLQQKCSPKNVVFSAEITENQCIMHWWSHYELLNMTILLTQYFFKFNCKYDFTMMKFV